MKLPKPHNNKKKAPDYLKPIFKTGHGSLFLGKSENVLLSKELRRYEGKVQLIFTSPPFPLNKKKRYGNEQGDAYVKWLAAYAPIFRKILAPKGSIVIEIGNAWEAGAPVQSLLPYKSILKFIESGNFKLCQEITYYNPARLPTPAQWVTIERIRLKDATTKLWWIAKSDKPKADNRRVLRPYSDHMKNLLRTGKYNAGERPSQHRIGETSFLNDNGGAIAPNLIEAANTHDDNGGVIASNLIEAANTHSSNIYLKFCKDMNLNPHPARMAESVVEFFVKFLTEPGDIVLDPFSGSNTTGAVVERLDRKWISIEADPGFAVSGVSRFAESKAVKLLKKFNLHNEA